MTADVLLTALPLLPLSYVAWALLGPRIIRRKNKWEEPWN